MVGQRILGGKMETNGNRTGGGVNVALIICSTICVAALVVTLIFVLRRNRLETENGSADAQALSEAKAETSELKEQLAKKEAELSGAKAELGARKAAEGQGENAALEQAYRDLSETQAALTSALSALDAKEEELVALREAYASSAADSNAYSDGFPSGNASSESGNYLYLDILNEKSGNPTKLQYGKDSPYEIPSGSLLAYDPDVRWLVPYGFSSLDEASQQIYRDNVLPTWKPENQDKLLGMWSQRIYFTQGRYQNQNNLIIGYSAVYDNGTPQGATFYTFIGYYDVELVDGRIRVNLDHYYSPVAAWDSENQVGLGANYPVSSNTSVAGFASLREMESQAIIADSRNHWKYCCDVTHGH